MGVSGVWRLRGQGTAPVISFFTANAQVDEVYTLKVVGLNTDITYVRPGLGPAAHYCD